MELLQLLQLYCLNWVIIFSGVFLQFTPSFESHGLCWSSALLQRHPSQLVLVLSCWCAGWKKATTVWPSFLYLYGCILSVVTNVDNLSHLMPFKSYWTFKPGSRPWYPCPIRFCRIMWYLKCWVTYVPQFHAFFSPSYVDLWSANLASDAVASTWFWTNHLQFMAWYAPLSSLFYLCCLTYGYRSVSLQIWSMILVVYFILWCTFFDWLCT